jgi:hypothetical protein
MVGATPKLAADIKKWGVTVVEESDVDVGSDHRMLIAPEVSTGLAKAVKEQQKGEMEPKRKKGWMRKSVRRPSIWEEMRASGEKQMEVFVAEWRQDMLRLAASGDAEVLESEGVWDRYRVNTIDALEAGVGRTSGRVKKCQGNGISFLTLRCNG